MILTGVLINAAAVAAGGVLGTLGGRFMPEKMKQTVLAATGLVSIGIGISGAIGSSNQLIPILSLVIGSVIGELLHIEDGVTRAGDWLQKRFGKSGSITEGFVTSLWIMELIFMQCRQWKHRMAAELCPWRSRYRRPLMRARR